MYNKYYRFNIHWKTTGEMVQNLCGNTSAGTEFHRLDLRADLHFLLMFNMETQKNIGNVQAIIIKIYLFSKEII